MSEVESKPNGETPNLRGQKDYWIEESRNNWNSKTTSVRKLLKDTILSYPPN